MLGFDWTYPHSYEVEELRELPGSGKCDVPVFYIPRPKGRPEHDGLWLKFLTADGKPWVGVFAFGYSSPPAFSRVLSSPRPDQVCAIANGKGFLVSPGVSEKWEEIQVLPVLEARAVPERKLLIFGDFSSLAAYGSSGLVWRSPRVCWDDLKIVTITDDLIEGTGYDPTTLGVSRFLVDLKTGRSLLPSPVSTDGRRLW